MLESLRTGQNLERILVGEGIEFGVQLREALLLADKMGIAVEHLPRSKIDRYSRTKKAQGVIAFKRDERYHSLKELVSAKSPALIAVLDGIQDPHNLGAIARTLEAFGGNGIVVRDERSVGITPGAIRASAGALEHLKVAKVRSIPRTLTELHSKGLKIIGLDGSAKKSPTEVDLTGATALVIGAEHGGLSKEAREECDVMVGLSLTGRIESLNAAVAAAILIYEVARARDTQT